MADCVCGAVESAISIGVTIYSMRMRSIKQITHSRSIADICKYFEIKKYGWTGRRLAIIYSYLGVLADHHIVFVIFFFSFVRNMHAHIQKTNLLAEKNNQFAIFGSIKCNKCVIY